MITDSKHIIFDIECGVVCGEIFMLTAEIRGSYLKFFENNGHTIVESSSLIPQNDPSLLFTNAGMVQFKDVFTGLETRPFKRATSSQKCVRAGGKHNDLDQVGYTARHHTFFEMLGNFSFGDYFKEDAIPFAWDFLTKELKLPKEKLLVTVYHTDEEAAKIWKKVAGNITIIPISTNDNFWSMGDTGPCGPCSEIFYDHGEHVFGGMPGTPDEDGDRYMEIWNIVFMQFEKKANGECVPLAKKCIDTGMGLERIAAVMQNVGDNYSIDLFKGIIDEIKTISKTNHDDIYPSYKVIADHIRSISFLISDGVVPSNEGRGYVLRRILRRAMRHGNLIGIKKPFLYTLSKSVIDSMGIAYPELVKTQELIKTTIKQEEEKFLDTLDRGLKILETEIKNISEGGTLSGDKAFKMYDTYGFPLDLTEDILKSKSIKIDTEGFENALQEQKNRAKWAGSGDKKESEVWHNLAEKLNPSHFNGYENDEAKGKILSLIFNDREVDSLNVDTLGYVVTDLTPFYAECGGQCGDIGEIATSSGTFIVSDTHKFCGKIIAHYGRVKSGKITVFGNAILRINKKYRRATEANHTATHLLQSALRTVLGKHIMQRGSYLNNERLRFDFSHSSGISDEDLNRVEQIVNQNILDNASVSVKEMSKENAMESGAMALFGEKYADRVRTVKINNGKDVVSFELCGGTHVSSTGKIGLFKILSESSIGAGIRRIEAITGESLLTYIKQNDMLINEISVNLKCAPTQISQKIQEMMSTIRSLEKEVQTYKQNSAINDIQEISANNISIFAVSVNKYTIDELRTLNDAVKSKYPSGIVVLINQSGEKFSIIVSVSKDLQKQYNAGNILKKCLAKFGARGGGSNSFAQGGGSGNGKSIINEIANNLC